ncbi:hypothetical protein [Rossellomorea sp. BNER]|uniref:hypothetical protein n=1 Tax=Rossellomorea sp. BNER TaxID=2962031 RepID=UPI003AF1E928|nr:hypothetical protein [Rossellomorea sp. BNER]
MSRDYHRIFNDRVGDCVRIRCHDGKVYHGYIDHCDQRNVYMRPLCNDDGPDRGVFFFFGAALITIGLASIAAFSFSPFFW